MPEARSSSAKSPPDAEINSRYNARRVHAVRRAYRDGSRSMPVCAINGSTSVGCVISLHWRPGRNAAHLPDGPVRLHAELRAGGEFHHRPGLAHVFSRGKAEASIINPLKPARNAYEYSPDFCHDQAPERPVLRQFRERFNHCRRDGCRKMRQMP